MGPMSSLYPLRFEPLFQHYVWGGRRLATMLGKPIGPEADYAESWEVVDHHDGQAVVAFGDQAGRSLGELVRDCGADLFGRDDPQPRFPLLFKFLDANRPLSVQVHPSDEQAARLQPPDLGKTEAWVVIHADAGSALWAGLRRGFDRHALERELARDTAELCLHRIEPRAGDCLFLPAGVVHALGEGIVIAEIQQASNTTFRLFDWNRVDASGQSRELHIQEALEVIDYEYGPVIPRTPQGTDRDFVERLVECDKFVMDRWTFDRPGDAGGDDRFHIMAVLEGSIQVAGDPSDRPLSAGQTVLVPASVGTTSLRPAGRTVLLDMYLPR